MIEEEVVEISVQICRILVVAYDTEYRLPCRIAWAGEDTRGSLPLSFEGLLEIVNTGVVLDNNGAVKPYKIDLSREHHVQLYRIVEILKEYLRRDNARITAASFHMEWRFDNAGEF